MGKRGKFIVIEGQGFSGKTAQMPLLAEILREKGLSVVETQEPGGVASAQAIREEILDRRQKGDLTPEQELELFYKSRERFLEELVRPALLRGEWVISTRFSASTYVYQGKEGGIDRKVIDEWDEKIVDGTQPDLYILLDVKEEEIFKRIKSNNTRIKHSFNEEDMEKIKSRRKGYKELAEENRYGNWVVVDGGQSIQQVADDIRNVVLNRFDFNGL